MLLKKSLMSIVLALPLVSTFAHAEKGGYGPMGPVGPVGISPLDDLRNRCMDFRANSQITPFSVKILCSGSYSFWEVEQGEFYLPGQAVMHTQATMKCNRFETSPSMFTFELAPQAGPCERYVKKVMHAPVGGIVVDLAQCEDLMPEVVEGICREHVHSYCGDQHVFVGSSISSSPSISHSSSPSISHSSSVSDDFSSSPSTYSGAVVAGPGLCSLETVEVIDTCAMY